MGGSSSQTIGYRYFMGLHMAICHGPVDSIHQIYVGKRSLDITPQTSNSTITVYQPGLFGGDEKEGGIVGDIDFEFGASDQLVNPYLSTQFGATTPAFRGVTTAVFHVTALTASAYDNYKSNSSGGYLAAMSPYPKAWAWEVISIPGGVFNPTKKFIDTDSCNGGHIIYDSLTDSDWGLGMPTEALDTASFTDATDTLFTENFALSLIYAQQSSMESFIQEVLNHINAVIYTSRTTGQFVLKLIRDDFDVGSLPVFDETNIVSLVSFQRPAFAELVNEIVLTYRRKGDFEDTTITMQDLASIQAQGGVVSQSVSFDGIDSDALAAIVGQRELKQASTPLARCKLVVNREAWASNPGDVIKLSWGSLGVVQLVLRVVEVNYGSFKDGNVQLDCVEDIFGLPSNSYITPVVSGWSDEVVSPDPAASTLIAEAPYFVTQTQYAQEVIDELTAGLALLQAMAENPPTSAFNFKLNTRIGAAAYGEVADSDLTPTCLLAGALDETTLAITVDTFRGNASGIVIGGYAYLNGEALRVDAIDVGAGTATIGRGYLDTIPTAHADNSIIYFADTHSALDPTLYSSSDSVDAKCLTQTGIGVLALADAVEDTLVMTGRREKPYPAAQIKISGVYFPTSLDVSTVVVSWTHQDRTQQLVAGGDDWYNISLGSPEDGVTYNVRFSIDGSTVLKYETGITGTSSQLTVVGAVGLTFQMQIELETVRGGVTSLQSFDHVFTYTKPLEVRTLKNANTRTLMNGNRRTLES